MFLVFITHTRTSTTVGILEIHKEGKIKIIYNKKSNYHFLQTHSKYFYLFPYTSPPNI